MTSEKCTLQPGDRVRYRPRSDYGPTYGGVKLADLVWRVEKVAASADLEHLGPLVFAKSEGDDKLGVFDVPGRFDRVLIRAEPEAICWFDGETEGLEPREHDMLEIAWILTRFAYPYEELQRGSRLLAGEGARRIVAGEGHEKVLAMHQGNGLAADLSGVLAVPAVANVSTKERAEAWLVGMSDGWPLEDRDARVVLGGNSAHFDLGFLRVHMPSFARRLSHRVFDVSAMLMQARSLGMPAPPKEEPAHRAMADVEHSIATARRIAEWYRSKGLRP